MFINKLLKRLGACLMLSMGCMTAYADNQTPDVSPVLSNAALPYRIQIDLAPFQLPVGLHSGAVGRYKDYWIFIAGRMNGLHGFNSGAGNFAPDQQNTSIYVINSTTGASASRALSDPSSGLTQQQIEILSVTSPEWYQDANTLYLAGGYGVDTAIGSFDTKPFLTAIYLPGIVDWVMQPNNINFSVIKNIRQVYHPIFQVTGGKMFKSGNITQLIFGQNYSGIYAFNIDGIYSEQVRRFKLGEVNGQLYVDVLPSKPAIPDPNYRRRDLNILPVLLTQNNKLQDGFVAYSGVFTPTRGIWTVPVVINATGDTTMADPSLPTTFKQGMNNYASAATSFYSRRYQSMFSLFFGGMSYINNGAPDPQIPFSNQVTTIQMDKNGLFTQYLMDGQYPVILSTQSNPGNQLLFGAGAHFLVNNNILTYPNHVISLDTIRRPTVIGYIVGGIQSTLPNTNDQADSAASPYVFKVTLVPTQ